MSTCTVNSATGASPSKSQYQAYPGLFWSIEEVYRFHSFTGNMAQLWETKDRIGWVKCELLLVNKAYSESSLGSQNDIYRIASGETRLYVSISRLILSVYDISWYVSAKVRSFRIKHAKIASREVEIYTVSAVFDRASSLPLAFPFGASLKFEKL